MSYASKFNKPSVSFNYEIPESHNFAKPSELYSEHGSDYTYTVRSMYINTKGKFGAEPVIITDECLMNAPKHVLDAVQTMLTDETAIELINSGKIGFKLYEYSNQYGKQYSITWLDI